MAYKYPYDDEPKTVVRSKLTTNRQMWKLVIFNVLIVWYFDLTKRIEEALEYRKIDCEFGTQDFWIWYVVGSFFLIGPLVYFHKMCRAMNLLCEHYNENPIIAED